MKNRIDLDTHKAVLLNDRGNGSIYADLFTYGKTVEFNAFYLEPGTGLNISRLNGRLYKTATHTEPDETQKFKTFEEGIQYFDQYVKEHSMDEKEQTIPQNNKLSEPEAEKEEVSFDQIDVTVEGITSIAEPIKETESTQPTQEDNTMNFSGTPQPSFLDAVKNQAEQNIEQAKANIEKLEGEQERKDTLIKLIDSIRDGMSEEQAYELNNLSSREGITLSAMESVADIRMSAVQMEAAAYMSIADDTLTPKDIQDAICVTPHETPADYLSARKDLAEDLDTMEKAGASKESLEQTAEMYKMAEQDAIHADANLYKMSVEEALKAGYIKMNSEDAKQKEPKTSDKDVFDSANKAIVSYFRGARDTAVDFLKKVADIPRQAAKEVKGRVVNAVEHFQDKVQNTYETKYLEYTKKQEIAAKSRASEIKAQIDKINDKHKSRLDAMYHIDGLKRFVTGKPEISKEEFIKNDPGVNSPHMKKLMEKYEDAVIDSTNLSIRRENLEESIKAYHEKWEDHKFGGGVDEKIDAATRKAAELAKEAAEQTRGETAKNTRDADAR